MAQFDFGALQDLALDPTGHDGEIDDGLFDRLAQILKASLPIGRLPSAADAMALFRHVLRRQSLRAGQQAQLRVPTRPGWPDRAAWASYGVRAHSEANGHVLIEARPWRASWLEESNNPVFEDVFAEQNVRLDWQRPIDPFLGEASGFETYVSPGQREAVRSAFLLPPGVPDARRRPARIARGVPSGRALPDLADVGNDDTRHGHHHRRIVRPSPHRPDGRLDPSAT